jgi:hypothetical protein
MSQKAEPETLINTLLKTFLKAMSRNDRQKQWASTLSGPSKQFIFSLTLRVSASQQVLER